MKDEAHVEVTIKIGGKTYEGSLVLTAHQTPEERAKRLEALGKRMLKFVGAQS